MEEALTARMRRYSMKFLRVILCLFVVKNTLVIMRAAGGGLRGSVCRGRPALLLRQ